LTIRLSCVLNFLDKCAGAERICSSLSGCSRVLFHLDVGMCEQRATEDIQSAVVQATAFAHGITRLQCAQSRFQARHFATRICAIRHGLPHLAVCGCFTSKAGPQREPQVCQAAVEHSWRRTRRKRRQ
jgi:hypothetical protein